MWKGPHLACASGPPRHRRIFLNGPWKTHCSTLQLLKFICRNMQKSRGMWLGEVDSTIRERRVEAAMAAARGSARQSRRARQVPETPAQRDDVPVCRCLRCRSDDGTYNEPWVCALRRVACQQDSCDSTYHSAAQHGKKCNCECRAKSKLKTLTRDTVEELWGLHSAQGPRFESRCWIACRSCLQARRRILAAVRDASQMV